MGEPTIAPVTNQNDLQFMQTTSQKAKIKAEKEKRDALSTVKWMPYLAGVVFSLLVSQIIGLAQHPGTERLIRLICPVGMMLCCLAHWSRAFLVLNGGRNTWQLAVLLMGLLMSGAGQSLADMYHHKQMALFMMLGSGTLAVVLFCLGMLVWEGMDVWRAAQRKRLFPMLPSLDD
jgi:hypothetical protein